MLEDAGAPLLLTQQHLAKPLPAGKWQVLDVDELRTSNYPVAPIENPVSGNDLAYVIYTSGSTGRPKGVQITHASLLNLVFWHQQTFGVQPGDRATQLASPAFDAAVWELWPYLTAGASVYLPADVVRNEPTLLRDWLVAHRITITFVPTPLAERMITLAVAAGYSSSITPNRCRYASRLPATWSAFYVGQQLRAYRMHCCGLIGRRT